MRSPNVRMPIPCLVILIYYFHLLSNVVVFDQLNYHHGQFVQSIGRMDAPKVKSGKMGYMLYLVECSAFLFIGGNMCDF